MSDVHTITIKNCLLDSELQESNHVDPMLKDMETIEETYTLSSIINQINYLSKKAMRLSYDLAKDESATLPIFKEKLKIIKAYHYNINVLKELRSIANGNNYNNIFTKDELDSEKLSLVLFKANKNKDRKLQAFISEQIDYLTEKIATCKRDMDNFNKKVEINVQLIKIKDE